MARGILLVFSNPSAPDRVDEFNAWYDSVHLPEFLRLEGVTRARRFALSTSQMPQPPEPALGGRSFLAAYEVETDDFEALCEEIMSTARDRTQSDALERDPLPLALVFEELGDAQTLPLPRTATSE